MSGLQEAVDAAAANETSHQSRWSPALSGHTFPQPAEPQKSKCAVTVTEDPPANDLDPTRGLLMVSTKVSLQRLGATRGPRPGVLGDLSASLRASGSQAGTTDHYRDVTSLIMMREFAEKSPRKGTQDRAHGVSLRTPRDRRTRPGREEGAGVSGPARPGPGPSG